MENKMKKYTKIINESLIKSYPIRFLEKRIKKIFSDIEISINEDYMILNFYHNITKHQYDNLLKELKLSGYFISYITTNNIFNSNKFTIQIDKKYPENSPGYGEGTGKFKNYPDINWQVEWWQTKIPNLRKIKVRVYGKVEKEGSPQQIEIVTYLANKN